MKLKKLGLLDQEFDTQRICDGCPQPFEPGDHVAIYFSDTLWNEHVSGKAPVITPQGGYCLNCYQEEIPLPRNGTVEGFTFAVVEYQSDTERYSYDEKGIMRGSKASEGIIWDPEEVVKKLHPSSLEDFNHNVTPMSTFINLYRMGVDLRGFVIDGELHIPDDAISTAKEVIRQNSEHRPRHTFNTTML